MICKVCLRQYSLSSSLKSVKFQEKSGFEQAILDESEGRPLFFSKYLSAKL